MCRKNRLWGDASAADCQIMAVWTECDILHRAVLRCAVCRKDSGGTRICKVDDCDGVIAFHDCNRIPVRPKGEANALFNCLKTEMLFKVGADTRTWPPAKAPKYFPLGLLPLGLNATCLVFRSAWPGQASSLRLKASKIRSWSPQVATYVPSWLKARQGTFSVVIGALYGGKRLIACLRALSACGVGDHCIESDASLAAYSGSFEVKAA